MYDVSRQTHARHGPVVVIELVMNGSLLTPFQAVQCACKERRLWMVAGPKKVRILVDDQVLSPKQAEHWAHEEYATLPKCAGCAKVLTGDLQKHQLSDEFFCSADCADRNYNEQVERIQDEEEIDYL